MNIPASPITMLHPARKLPLLIIYMALSCLVPSGSVLSATDPLPTPLWLAGKRELLPPISPETVAIMKETWPKLKEEWGYRQPPSEIYLQGARQVLELGEQAGLAFVWMYVEDPPAGMDLDAIGRKKRQTLNAISGDPIAGKWLIPILRVRIDWVRAHLKAGTLDQTQFTLGELTQMEAFMIVQGSQSDLDNIQRLMEELRHSGTEAGRNLWPLTGTPEERAAEDAKRRADRQAGLRPFYQLFKHNEKYLGPVKVVTPTTTETTTQPEQRPSKQATKLKPTAEVQTIEQGWAVWAFILIAALFITWRFMRKAK